MRRRCRLIIVGDGECDPLHTFHALGTAIRRCQVDMGVDIKIDTRELVPDATTGRCRAHAAFGTIKYPNIASEAVLVYLKSSLTGDEEVDLQQYKSRSPAFPHEPTGDQFFSESQFESYRKLGLHIARKTFRPNKKASQKLEELALTSGDWAMHNRAFDSYFDDLQRFWRPPPRISSVSFVSHSTTLTEIWRKAMDDTSLRGFDRVLMPEWHPLVQAASPILSDLVRKQAQPPASAPVVDDEPARKAAYLTQELIQLMENIYLDLDLHHDSDHKDHSGWMNLFRHWAGQKEIRDAWEYSGHLYGERFIHFCTDTLHLPPVRRHDLLPQRTIA